MSHRIPSYLAPTALLLQALADRVPRADLRLYHRLLTLIIVLGPRPHPNQLLHLALRLFSAPGGPEDQQPLAAVHVALQEAEGLRLVLDVSQGGASPLA